MRAERLGLFTIIHEGEELLHFNNHLTSGGIACAMSHRKALMAAAQHPTADWSLIMEDDISGVVPCFDSVLAGVFAQLPQDWDTVLIGYHDSVGQLAQAHGDALAESWAMPSWKHDYGLYGLVVRTGVAQQIVERCFPVNGQVDKAITGWLVREGFNSFRVDPRNMLLTSPKSEESLDSDVQTMGEVESILERHGSVERYNEHILGERDLFA
uniref:Uncharacterized protein n=1 Tax=Zooxanthella nutricula TaxID=1333877 RepID=A0A7S2VG81_9DINO